MAAAKPKPVHVSAVFEAEAGISNTPQAPTANDIVGKFSAEIVEYIASQQREINRLKAELKK